LKVEKYTSKKTHYLNDLVVIEINLLYLISFVSLQWKYLWFKMFLFKEEN